VKEIHDRIDRIEQRITFINHELGVVIGKLGVLQWLICGVFAAVVFKIALDILNGG
jgi:tetrahydromethanopterin S-methyltransferase subunit G